MTRIIAFSFCCLLPACSKFVPVEGTITLDGKPVADASVAFHPVDVPSVKSGGPQQGSAATDENGRFRLFTTNDEGAWPGTYKVTVSKRELPPDLKEEYEKTGSISPMRRPGFKLPPGIDPDMLKKMESGEMPPLPGMMGPAPINPGDYMKETLPEIYIKESTTPLTIEIPEGGTKEANLELTSSP